MESMMKIPDDMFKQEILQYLTFDDIVKLDNACMNHKYRSQLLEKINGVVLAGDNDEYMKASSFKWLGMRQIYLINMKISSNSISGIGMDNDYVDQFRYTRHLFMRGSIRDDIAIFIISHCPCLLSIVIGDDEHPCPQVTDHTLKWIAEHCTGRLQSLSLIDCRHITDSGLIIISMHCTNLKSLNVDICHQLTDDSIISISTHCTGLQSLDLSWSRQITDTSIISISTHCTGLKSLHLQGCYKITDASIISISTHCTGLQSINLGSCWQITDVSIISISENCTDLKELDVSYTKITDASLIAIAENCTCLKRLDVSYTNITDASLIAIAKNCNGLQSLLTSNCNGLSSDDL